MPVSVINPIACFVSNTKHTSPSSGALTITSCGVTTAPSPIILPAKASSGVVERSAAILQDIRNIENRASVSSTGMFIRAIIGFILTLVGIYLVFMYLKNKTKKISGSNEIIKILATTTVASNRYISIIEIADKMYLISISDHNINLLEKIEDKEIKDQIRMMYINSKENVVEDSFKNILNQTLSIFKQPKMKEKDALQSTKEIRERLRNLNSNDNNENNK